MAGSQKPSRSRSFCGGALSRGDDGEPYAFLLLFPQPRLFLVLTPVIGLVPLAYLQSACIDKTCMEDYLISAYLFFSLFVSSCINLINITLFIQEKGKQVGSETCFWERSKTASLKSAPSIIAPARSLRVRTDLTSTAFVRLASFRTCTHN